jgi:hypothetical protein
MIAYRSKGANFISSLKINYFLISVALIPLHSELELIIIIIKSWKLLAMANGG